MPKPIILSTWSFGQRANRAAWGTLARGGSSLDAVEIACRDAEDDPENPTVGLGGLPDRSGEVTLDASIMLSPEQRGAVAYVKKYLHPISIARAVMEKTHHVLLAGDGAEAFAGANGFSQSDVLTDKARAAWETWKSEEGKAPARHKRNFEELGLSDSDIEGSHDTIGVLALDANGILAGGCTTSGLAFKIPGRVGDSPIIGHGLYVDPSAGAAVATGHGELVMGICGSFLAVELLRHGATPIEAALQVAQRIQHTYQLSGEDQVGIIVLARDGNWGSASLRPGFRVAVRDASQDELVNSHRVLIP